MSKLGYYFRTEASLDVIETAVYIGLDDLKAADAFLLAVESACKNITIFPNIGRKKSYKNEALKDIRLLPVPKFPNYLIFYRLQNKKIEVIRILDGRRDLPSLLK